MIKIKLKCFSQVKYAFGKSEISYELKEGTTIKEFEKMVRKKAKGKLDNVSISVAINKQYTSNNAEIKDGDEVAFIPPVQGG